MTLVVALLLPEWYLNTGADGTVAITTDDLIADSGFGNRAVILIVAIITSD